LAERGTQDPLEPAYRSAIHLSQNLNKGRLE
jgi:hypothetical protein